VTPVWFGVYLVRCSARSWGTTAVGVAGVQCALVPLQEQQEGHVHGPGCGHDAVPHDGHFDYLVSRRRALQHSALRQASAAVLRPDPAEHMVLLQPS
jgi:hypothetical protein